MKVDEILKKSFNAVVLVVVRETLISAQLFERRLEAARVSIEGSELRSTFPFEFRCAILF